MKEKNDNIRRNSTRRDINRLLSTHLGKSPLETTIRHTVSPKNGPLDVNYLASLIRNTVTSHSRPRGGGRQKDKNCSAGSLGDKREKDRHLVITNYEAVGKGNNYAKKSPDSVLNSIKKKIFTKTGNDLKKGISNDHLHKQSLISMIPKDIKVKSSAGLRPMKPGVRSAKYETME